MAHSAAVSDVIDITDDRCVVFNSADGKRFRRCHNVGISFFFTLFHIDSLIVIDDVASVHAFDDCRILALLNRGIIDCGFFT